MTQFGWTLLKNGDDFCVHKSVTNVAIWSPMIQFGWTSLKRWGQFVCLQIGHQCHNLVTNDVIWLDIVKKMGMIFKIW